MTDLRTIHWKEIRDTLTGKREAIHSFMDTFSPCTATELAEKISWDKCSVRPRLSELLSAGLIEKTGVRRDSEHEFIHVSLAEAERRARVAEQIAADAGEIFTLSGE